MNEWYALLLFAGCWSSARCCCGIHSSRRTMVATVAAIAIASLLGRQKKMVLLEQLELRCGWFVVET
jgi:hypothetical protein